MSRRWSNILLAAAVWTFYVWITRVIIIAGQDRSTGFKAVHFVLAAISIAFGVATGWIALKSRNTSTRS
ncbi:MAG: hypothetical protein ABR579_11325 [Actinomycetota bacterium]